MGRRKRSDAFEQKLSFLNEVSAGIGLLVGYALFGVYWLTTPNAVVEVATQEIVYEEKVLGHIPEPQTIESLDSVSDLERTIPVTAKFPMLNEDGTPKLREKVVKFTGKGSPQVIVDHKEIVTPKLVSDEVRVVRSGSNSEARFYLETIFHGTGYYYEDKSIIFDGVMSADIFAVRLGTLFAFLALVLLVIRVRAVPRSIKFIKGLFAPEEHSVHEPLSAHYEHVERFKKQDAERMRLKEAKFLERFQDKTDIAHESILAFLSKAKPFIESTKYSDRYLVCIDSVLFIEAPDYCDLDDKGESNKGTTCTDPLDAKHYSLEQAELLARYYREEGYPSVDVVNLIAATKDMINIHEKLLRMLERHAH